ncbi:MAG: outer membrane protein transport protein [candidate division Zixibacteria bacterium]|nr:outer membrane protein transport protein [candidate division Zixibacteria bacterium]
MFKSLLKVVVVIAFLATTAASQTYLPHSSFDFTWGGARAEAMGNAYLGLADDITAGAWNPAGLVGFEGPTLGFSLGSTAPHGYTDYSIQSRQWRYDQSGSLSNVSSLNFIAPFRIKGHPFVGSVNFTRNFEDLMGFGYNYEIEDYRWVPRTGNIWELDTFLLDVGTRVIDEGGVSSVAFSFGTRVYENTSLGIGVNIYTGRNTEEVFYTQLLADLPITPGAQEVDEVVDVYIVDTTKFSGVNFTLGLKKIGERFSAGLVLRTPFSLNLKTGSSIYQVKSINGLPQEEDTDTTFIDNQLTKYTLPLTIGAGLALNVGDDAVITADAEYRGYGSTKFKRRDSLRIDPAGNNEEYFTDIDPEWNNIFSMRFGSEYRINSSIGMIPLRAGMGMVAIPWPNRSESKSPHGNFNFPHLIFMPFVKALNKDDTPIRSTYSLGSGIHWSQIKLDWAYTYSTVYRNWGETVVEAKMRDHHFGFTFTGVF